ncbi:hypothetical protein JJD41_16995 [Oxynema sp. CENA135]|uniref:hypothetical protein n=1 Tax=Oxynema sp. CENA135 TaxID=984206 RepID=UPI00190CC6FB|nr:hypothetical protein [Oxynema sp. CENA135]MBK4731549.1 hypothetical protein [Oxynema sp. CENA135]
MNNTSLNQADKIKNSTNNLANNQNQDSIKILLFYLVRLVFSFLIISKLKNKIVLHRSFICHFMPRLYEVIKTDTDAINRVIEKISENPDTEIKSLSESLEKNVFLLENIGLIITLFLIVTSTTVFGIHNLKGKFETAQIEKEQLQSQEENIIPLEEGNELESSQRALERQIPNPFYQERFPQSSCGDPLPQNPEEYPITFYPVFASYSERNLSIIQDYYCTDAYGPITRDNGQIGIQVASFVGRQRSELFQQFMNEQVPQALWEIGNPTIINSP